MPTDAGPVVVSRPLPYLDVAAWRLPRHPLVVLDAEPTGRSLQEAGADAVGLIVAGEHVDADVIASAPHLSVIAQYGIGVDNIDLEAAAAAGVTVVNLPDLVTDATAELTIGLMLACARRVVEADRAVRGHRGFPGGTDPLLSTGLHGRRLGLVGLGRIGQRVGEIASALGMQLHYWGRTRKPSEERRLGAVWHQDVTALCRNIDVLTVHVPHTPATRGLIGSDQLRALPDDAVVINTARGGIIDEDALLEALRADELASVGLDVFEGEPRVADGFLDDPRTVLTPHVGTSTVPTRRAMSRTILEEVATVLEGREPRNRVSPSTDR